MDLWPEVLGTPCFWRGHLETDGERTGLFCVVPAAQPVVGSQELDFLCEPLQAKSSRCVPSQAAPDLCLAEIPMGIWSTV